MKDLKHILKLSHNPCTPLEIALTTLNAATFNKVNVTASQIFSVKFTVCNRTEKWYLYVYHFLPLDFCILQTELKLYRKEAGSYFAFNTSANS
jgi:hypothetical protein